MRGLSSLPIQKSYAGHPEVPAAAVSALFRKEVAYSVMDRDTDSMTAPVNSSTKWSAAQRNGSTGIQNVNTKQNAYVMMKICKPACRNEAWKLRPNS